MPLSFKNYSLFSAYRNVGNELENSVMAKENTNAV